MTNTPASHAARSNSARKAKREMAVENRTLCFCKNTIWWDLHAKKAVLVPWLLQDARGRRPAARSRLRPQLPLGVNLWSKTRERSCTLVFFSGGCEMGSDPGGAAGEATKSTGEEEEAEERRKKMRLVCKDGPPSSWHWQRTPSRKSCTSDFLGCRPADDKPAPLGFRLPLLPPRSTLNKRGVGSDISGGERGCRCFTWLYSAKTLPQQTLLQLSRKKKLVGGSSPGKDSVLGVVWKKVTTFL